MKEHSKRRFNPYWFILVFAGYVQFSIAYILLNSSFGWARSIDITPVYQWFIIGTWLTYVFASQIILERKDGFRYPEENDQRGIMENLRFSIVPFFVWLVIVIMYSQSSTVRNDQWLFDTMIIIAGLIFCYLALAIYNRKWVIE